MIYIIIINNTSTVRIVLFISNRIVIVGLKSHQ